MGKYSSTQKRRFRLKQAKLEIESLKRDLAKAENGANSEVEESAEESRNTAIEQLEKEEGEVSNKKSTKELVQDILQKKKEKIIKKLEGKESAKPEKVAADKFLDRSVENLENLPSKNLARGGDIAHLDNTDFSTSQEEPDRKNIVRILPKIELVIDRYFNLSTGRVEEKVEVKSPKITVVGGVRLTPRILTEAAEEELSENYTEDEPPTQQ